MIPAIELAEATAELHADYNGATNPKFVVTCNGYRLHFHQNLCGAWGVPCSDGQATRFNSPHEAGAACRKARLTGVISFDVVNS